LDAGRVNLRAAAESNTEPTTAGIARDLGHEAGRRTTQSSHLLFMACIPEGIGTATPLFGLGF